MEMIYYGITFFGGVVAAIIIFSILNIGQRADGYMLEMRYEELSKERDKLQADNIDLIKRVLQLIDGQKDLEREADWLREFNTKNIPLGEHTNKKREAV